MQRKEEGIIPSEEPAAFSFSPAALRRQLVWLLASIAVGAVALYFTYAEDCSEDLRRWMALQSPWLPPVVVGAGIVVVSFLRDRYFPGTQGTGIPQAIAALKMGEGPARDRLLSPRIALGKTLLLTLGLLTGATIGREGPSVHVAACLLYLTTRLAKYPRHLVERGVILAGGAAGIGAAFNTPVAAIIFAVEEIGRSFEKENAGAIVRTVVVACVLCWIPLSDYLFYGRIEAQMDAPGAWLVALGVGLVAGFLGGAFAQAVISASALVREWSSRRPYLTAVALGLALAMLGFVSSGQTYGGGFPQARAILIEGSHFPSWYALAKSAGSFVCLTSGIPGGLFDPTLSAGAGLADLFWPLVPGMERQVFVLLVMGAYFAGVVQSPVTAAVILVEMTGATHLMLPLLAVTITAYGASRLVCPTSLYEALAEAFLREGSRG